MQFIELEYYLYKKARGDRMDLKQIRYFLEVVDQGSINMAAHKLGMTQPPVSKQMQLLEQELGCELFRRNSRPLELTPEGKVLYERGSALLAMAQGMVQAVADCRNTQGGTLRLGLVSSVSELAVQRWIAPFGQMHPGVDFALYESNTYSLLERLRRRVIDLALVRTPFPSHGFLTQMLPSQPMLAIWDSARWDLCVENHGLALDQLAACPLVLYRRWEPIIQAAFDRHGLQPRIVAHDDSARTCLAMARAGLGVAMAPDTMRQPAIDLGLSAAPIDESSLYSRIALVCNEGGCDTAAGRAFWDFYQQALASGGDFLKG